jgi:hypothetical protein
MRFVSMKGTKATTINTSAMVLVTTDMQIPVHTIHLTPLLSMPGIVPKCELQPTKSDQSTQQSESS